MLGKKAISYQPSAVRSSQLSAISCQPSSFSGDGSGLRSVVDGLRSFFSCLFVSFFGYCVPFLLLLFLGGAGILEAGEAALDIRVPDEAVTVGDRISVRVQARGGEDGLWGDLALSPTAGNPWVVVEGPREVPGANPPAWEVVLVPLDVGDLELPGIEVSLRNTDGQAVNVAATEKPKITVASVLAPEDEGRPAPLRAPLGIEGFPWEWVAPLFVVLLPLVVLAAWWWRSRSGGAPEAGTPRLAPFDELERLLREVHGAIGRQPAAVVCDRLAWGVRHYLERRTGEPAVEMTSNELRTLARRSGWPQEVQLGLQRLTTVADGVRFGRRSVADSELEATGRSARDIGSELEIFLLPDVAGDEGNR